MKSLFSNLRSHIEEWQKEEPVRMNLLNNKSYQEYMRFKYERLCEYISILNMNK